MTEQAEAQTGDAADLAQALADAQVKLESATRGLSSLRTELLDAQAQEGHWMDEKSNFATTYGQIMARNKLPGELVNVSDPVWRAGHPEAARASDVMAGLEDQRREAAARVIRLSQQIEGQQQWVAKVNGEITTLLELKAKYERDQVAEQARRASGGRLSLTELSARLRR